MKAKAKPALTLRRLVLSVRRQAPRTVLALPEPPSVNALYANVPGVGRVKVKAYRQWLAAALGEITAQRVPYIPGDIVVTGVMPRSNARRDLDGCVKATLDALVKGFVIEDDSRVCEIHFRWGALPQCSITVETKEK